MLDPRSHWDWRCWESPRMWESKRASTKWNPAPRSGLDLAWKFDFSLKIIVIHLVGWVGSLWPSFHHYLLYLCSSSLSSWSSNTLGSEMTKEAKGCSSNHFSSCDWDQGYRCQRLPGGGDRHEEDGHDHDVCHLSVPSPPKNPTEVG